MKKNKPKKTYLPGCIRKIRINLLILLILPMFLFSQTKQFPLLYRVKSASDRTYKKSDTLYTNWLRITPGAYTFFIYTTDSANMTFKVYTKHANQVNFDTTSISYDYRYPGFTVNGSYYQALDTIKYYLCDYIKFKVICKDTLNPYMRRSSAKIYCGYIKW